MCVLQIYYYDYSINHVGQDMFNIKHYWCTVLYIYLKFTFKIILNHLNSFDI